MTEPFAEWQGITIFNGDCLQVLPALQQQVECVITDPPYGLSFMGKDWDHAVPDIRYWQACMQVLKPGGYLLAFGGTRLFHRLTCAIEDAGFEIRDVIMWVYGSGFPKGHDVSKAIDKELGVEGEVIGEQVITHDIRRNSYTADNSDRPNFTREVRAAGSPEAEQWQGYNTALKPAWEPIIVARKPLEGTVAQNILKHGAGAMNIDACRIGVDGGTAAVNFGADAGNKFGNGKGKPTNDVQQLDKGRWPANLVHDGSKEVIDLMPMTAPAVIGERGDRSGKHTDFNGSTGIRGIDDAGGSAARFFYCAKASASDRGSFNDHPTVKPQDLMKWLVTLVCPEGGTVLDPFMGSGSTLKAAKELGRKAIGIDLSEHFCSIAERRMAQGVLL